ncbi:hypothetical protein CYY_007076 [Polysphondylium violaceum]|uniref:Ankyrin repeat-containing protein n=1 Tax=Polysphondylium violaceum TaxID=133409 RepID=A0A8J4PP58_9MYCE|nr:hypothetical protein CYY_007076 [Polysphondylium violaceum]
MEILFKDIYNNVYLRQRIFCTFLNSDNGQRYNEICDLNWIILNKHFGLLGEKIKRNEYLFVSPECMTNTIYRIHDINLFILLYQRFHYYFIEPMKTLSNALEKNNVVAFNYLLEMVLQKDTQLNGSVLDFYRLFKACILYNDYKTLNQLFDLIENGRVHVSLLKKKIDDNDYLIPTLVIDVLEKKNKVSILKILNIKYDPLKVARDKTYIKIYDAAFHTGDIEIFTLVMEKYPIELDRIQYFILKSRYKISSNLYPLTEYLKKMKILENQYCIKGVDKMLLLYAFAEQDMDLFNKLIEKYPSEKDSLFKQLNLSNIKGSFSSLENVKGLLDLGVQVDKQCFIESLNSEATWDIFLYLSKCYSNKLLRGIDIGDFASAKKNMKLLRFLIESHPYYSMNQEFLKSDQHLSFYQSLLAHFPLSHYYLIECIGSTIKYGAMETFKYLYSLEKDLAQSIDISNLYYTAAVYSRNDFLLFLFEKNPDFKMPKGLITYASSSKTLDIIVKNGFDATKKTVNYCPSLHKIDIIHLISPLVSDKQDYFLNIIKLSIKQNKIQHFQTFLPFSANQDFAYEIGQIGNIEFLKIYQQYNPQTKYIRCFREAMQNGHLDMIKYLLDTLGFDYFLSEYQNHIKRLRNHILDSPGYNIVAYFKLYYQIIFKDYKDDNDS